MFRFFCLNRIIDDLESESKLTRDKKDKLLTNNKQNEFTIPHLNKNEVFVIYNESALD